MYIHVCVYRQHVLFEAPGMSVSSGALEPVPVDTEGAHMVPMLSLTFNQLKSFLLLNHTTSLRSILTMLKKIQNGSSGYISPLCAL